MTRADPPAVLLLAGSPSDLDGVLDCQETLESLGIRGDVRVLSAHRTPDEVAELVRGAAAAGYGSIIAFAGMAAHLAGVAAAHTLLPVIAVPIASGALSGVDAALACLQMPPGTPVATVAIDGARNGALLAARFLAVGNEAIRDALQTRLERDRERYEPRAIEAEVEKRKKARRPKA